MEIESTRPVAESHLSKWKNKGWCDYWYTFDIDADDNLYITDFYFELKSEKCPVKEIKKMTINNDGDIKVYGTI